jgi:5-methylcytosine-specific restriction endonuclease McrA
LADVRHHIIQIQNGGNNRWQNIIALCNDCHAVIHPWLRKS